MAQPSIPLPPSRYAGDQLAGLGRFVLFLGRIIVLLARPPWFFGRIVEETARVAVRCLIPVVLVLTPFGMILSLHGSSVFAMFGAERMLGLLVGIAIFRELAPNLAALLIAAQAGSAFAAELGAMRAQEEIDATLIMGVDPLKYHVTPRILGVTIAAPILTALGATSGLIGGWFLAVVMQGQNSGAFVDNLFTNLTLFDVWSSLLKAGVFGLLIGVLSCYYGYFAQGGAQGVGDAVNRTVVYSVTLFLVLNYFLSTALFGIVS